MNQPQAAELLGVSVATISRLCSGDRRPSLELMLTIQGELGWSVQDQTDEFGRGTYNEAFKKKVDEWQLPDQNTDPAEPAGGTSTPSLVASTGDPARGQASS